MCEVYLVVFVDVMKEEYEIIVGVGLDLQFDCFDLVLLWYMLFNDLFDDEFLKIVVFYVEVLNYVLQDVLVEKVCVYICWGNYEGLYVCDIFMFKMFDMLMLMKLCYVLFEILNLCYGYEWSVFCDCKVDILEDKVFVLGVVDMMMNFVEYFEFVVECVLCFVDIVGVDCVIVGFDCGFGIFVGFGVVDFDIVYVKFGFFLKGVVLVG